MDRQVDKKIKEGEFRYKFIVVSVFIGVDGVSMGSIVGWGKGVLSTNPSLVTL